MEPKSESGSNRRPAMVESIIECLKEYESLCEFRTETASRLFGHYGVIFYPSTWDKFSPYKRVYDLYKCFKRSKFDRLFPHFWMNFDRWSAVILSAVT